MWDETKHTFFSSQSPTLFTILNISVKEKQSQEMTSSNMTSSVDLWYWISFGKEERSSASTWSGTIPTSRPGDGAQAARWGRWTDGQMGGVTVSLDNLEVVQDGHDVLRHEDVAGVNSHAGHRDQQGVWRGGVKDRLTEEEEEHRFTDLFQTELWITFTS